MHLLMDRDDGVLIFTVHRYPLILTKETEGIITLLRMISSELSLVMIFFSLDRMTCKVFNHLG